MSKISRKEILKIASLAKLKLSEDEVVKFQGEFDQILGYISKIKEVDVSGVMPEHNLQNYQGEVLSSDQINEGLDNKKALSNSRNTRSKDGYFRTSKIVNKE